MSTKKIVDTLKRRNLTKNELKKLINELHELVTDSDASEGETDTVDDDSDSDSSVDEKKDPPISPEESAAISRMRIAEHDVQVAQENVNVEEKKLIIQQEKLNAYAEEILDSMRTTVEAHMKLTLFKGTNIQPYFSYAQTHYVETWRNGTSMHNPILNMDGDHTCKKLYNAINVNNSTNYTISPPVVAALNQLGKDYLNEYHIAYNQLTALNDSWTDVNKCVTELNAKILEYKRVLESAVVIRDKRILELEAVRRKEKQAR